MCLVPCLLTPPQCKKERVLLNVCCWKSLFFCIWDGLSISTTSLNGLSLDVTSKPRGLYSSPVETVCLRETFPFVSFLLLCFVQEPSLIPPAEAGPSWAAQAEVSSKPGGSQARQLKGQRLFPLLSSCFCCLFISFPLLTKTCSVHVQYSLWYDADTPVLSVDKSPPLMHDGSQISTFCRKGGGGAVAAAKEKERTC